MMPADLRERVWDVFTHGGDFEATEDGWKIVGIQDIPVGLMAILESPAYKPQVLSMAVQEKSLNAEAEALHDQLYGNAYYPPAMRHQLVARYHAIEAARRIRKLRPLSRPSEEDAA